MTPAAVAKLLEQVGIPLVVAGACGYSLVFVVRWILVTFKKDFEKKVEGLHKNLDEEMAIHREHLIELKTLSVRLTDRVRRLDQTLTALDATARTVWTLDKVPRNRTRSERREELEEALRDVGKNGDTL
jgi:hypothetical protein